MVKQIGYVGLEHSHSKLYFETFERLSVELSCVYDPGGENVRHRVPDTVSEEPRIYDDLDDLLETSAVDAIVAAVSNRETPDVIERAVRHEVDVFAEKSLARTASDLEPVADLVRASDTTIASAYVNRGDPIYRQLREYRRDGFFGELRAFEARIIKNKLEYRLQTQNQPDYLYTERDARGGIVQWLGCHYLDLLQWILDDPIVRVSARTTYGVNGVKTEDCAVVHLETASGALGSLHCGYYLADGPDERGDTAVGPSVRPLEIYGMDGAAVVNGDASALQLAADVSDWRSGPVRTCTFERPDVPGYGDQPGIDYLEAFFDLCDGVDDGGLVATIEDELRVLRVLDAIYESAETEQWVSVE